MSEPEVRQLAFPMGHEAARAFDGLRSIETSFPVLEISRLARIETYRKNMYRPAYYIHKWWARRPGVTFRSILLGTLLPKDHSPIDFLYQDHHFKDVVILDPFMGGAPPLARLCASKPKSLGWTSTPSLGS